MVSDYGTPWDHGPGTDHSPCQAPSALQCNWGPALLLQCKQPRLWPRSPWGANPLGAGDRCLEALWKSGSPRTSSLTPKRPTSCPIYQYQVFRFFFSDQCWMFLVVGIAIGSSPQHMYCKMYVFFVLRACCYCCCYFSGSSFTESVSRWVDEQVFLFFIFSVDWLVLHGPVYQPSLSKH